MSALADLAALKMLPLDHLKKHGFSDNTELWDNGTPKGGIRIEYGPDARARIRKHAHTSHPSYWAKPDANPMRVFGAAPWCLVDGAERQVGWRNEQSPPARHVRVAELPHCFKVGLIVEIGTVAG